MQGLVLQIVGGLVRVGLGGVIYWLVQRGIITEDQTGEVVAGVTLALVTVGWIVWNKIQASRLLNTAVALPSGKTVAQIEALAKAGTFASALTPRDHVPQLQSTDDRAVDPKRFISGILLAVLLGGLGSACALTAKNPTPGQQASARADAAEIIERLTLGIQIATQATDAVRTSTLPPAVKIELGCQILGAIGLDAPPATVTSNCGTVPTREKAPLHVAVKMTQDLTTCASRQNTLVVAQQATRPIWEKLERSNVLALQILGGSLKYAIQPITVTCGGRP